MCGFACSEFNISLSSNPKRVYCWAVYEFVCCFFACLSGGLWGCSALIPLCSERVDLIVASSIFHNHILQTELCRAVCSRGKGRKEGGKTLREQAVKKASNWRRRWVNSPIPPSGRQLPNGFLRRSADLSKNSLHQILSFRWTIPTPKGSNVSELAAGIIYKKEGRNVSIAAGLKSG